MESLADFLGAIDQNHPVANPNPPAAKVPFKERCRRIVESPEYFQSVLDRIRLGCLPPAIEQRILDEAYGKLADRVEVTTIKARLAELTVDQLEDRAMQLLARARDLRASRPNDSDSSVH